MPKKSSPLTEQEIAERSARFELALARAGMTERGLAEAVGLSTSHVNKVASGARPNAGIDFWIPVCSKLGVSVPWLAKGLGPMSHGEINSPPDRYPTRGPIVTGLKSVPHQTAVAVAEALLSEDQHETDPGPGYWTARASSLFSELSKG